MVISLGFIVVIEGGVKRIIQQKHMELTWLIEEERSRMIFKGA